MARRVRRSTRCGRHSVWVCSRPQRSTPRIARSSTCCARWTGRWTSASPTRSGTARGFRSKPSFLDESKQFFDAKVAPLDFSAPGAVPTINDWVKASTNGKIDNIVDDPIAADVVMYLINAIYFNGSWTTRFDRSLTKPDQFTTVDGSAAPIANDASHRHGSGWRDGGCAGGGAPVRWGCVCDDHPQPCSMTRRSR